jgi:hypothetical protein
MAGLLAVALLPLGAGAQERVPGDSAAPARTALIEGLPRPRYAASPLLPPDHWAVRAAHRAEALGLADGYLPAQRAVPRAQVETALRAAAERTAGSALAPVAAEWHARFVAEFPEYREGADALPVAPLGWTLGAGYALAKGRVAPAQGGETPAALPDRWGWGVHAMPAVRVGRWLAAYGEVRQGAGPGVEPRWNVVAGAGAFALSAGSETEAYGVGRGGGIVYSGTEPLPRVELSTTRALRLPGVLGRAGGVSMHTFASRTAGAREPGRPWLWGARLAVQPHRRLTVAVNRGSMFGGPPGDPVTARNLARMLVGAIRTNFENQMVSVDVRYRVPSERLLPAVAYLEWGADDGAGAFTDVPGQVAGVFLPALPGLDRVALGAEVARFGPPGDGNGPWYRHNLFYGNWARGDALLGHPLGGEGTEASVYGEAELPGGRLRVDARGFGRRRSATGQPSNILGPSRLGRSTGGEVEVLWRAWRSLELAAGVAGENGDGWRERRASAEVRVLPW